MSQAGVAGPLFISVGQPEQLAKFLELNDAELAGAKALIDDFMVKTPREVHDAPVNLLPPVIWLSRMLRRS